MPSSKSTPTKSGGIVNVRAAQMFFTTPGHLGYNAIIEPEDPFGDGLVFSANVHFTEESSERLITLMERDVVDANWEAFVKAAAKAEKAPPGGQWQKPDMRLWVQDHLKPAKEGAKQTLPHMKFTNKAEFRNRDGELVRKTMRAYDAKGKLLDLPGLHMGYGSIVQAVLMPGLFVSPLVKQPQPSLQLQGVRIIKLEQFGAGGAAVGEVSEEDMEMLGQDVEADDLSAYVPAAAKDKGATKPQGYTPQALDEDDLPF